MSFSIVHRVLTTKWAESVAANMGGQLGREYVVEAKKKNEDLASSVVVNVDEVAAYYCESEKTDWGSPEDFPCCAPPFSQFTLQWNLPELMRVNGNLVRAYNEVGPEELCHCTGAIIEDSLRPVLVRWLDKEYRHHVKEAKWVLRFSKWQFTRKKPFWLPFETWCLVGPTGMPLFSWMCSQFKQVHPELEAGIGRIHIPLLAMSFLNCRNVSIIDETKEHNPTPDTLRKLKTSSLTFKRLSIGQMKSVLRSEGKSDEIGLPKALHICRGHFAHYPNGIFNRTPGTPEVIWKPHHVRGKAENGIALKDYAVKAGGQG